jgi:imidazolonepropionase-like amidohydrolase
MLRPRTQCCPSGRPSRFSKCRDVRPATHLNFSEPATSVASGIDESMLRRMIAQHMTIIPTLKLFSRDDDIASIRGLNYRFHQLGGRLVYGTDTGFLPDYDQGEEFRQLTQAGFGFRDVLAMLTTAPAELVHLSEHEGKVMSGMRGDLTILSEDPASGHPDAFTEVRYTIRGGKVIWQSN